MAPLARSLSVILCAGHNALFNRLAHKMTDRSGSAGVKHQRRTFSAGRRRGNKRAVVKCDDSHSIINKPKKAGIGAGFRLRKSTDAMIDTIARIPMPMLD
jgi:hypothetical protein